VTADAADAPPEARNGAPLDDDPLAALTARVDALTTRLQLVATAVAGILAERMQPDIQQAILAQLTGQSPAPPP
jgi:hypothetical protein